MANQQTMAAPQSIDVAIAHHHAARLAEAEAIYRQILAAEPNHLDALHLLGVVAIQRGRAQEAIDLISQSLAGRPENHNALNHLGEAYRAMDRLDEASTCFERALHLKQDFFQAYNNLGNVCQAQGKLDQAIALYQKSLAINPGYAEAHVNLGNVFQEITNWNGAIECYQRALAIRPDFAEASFNLGNLFKVLRRTDEAIPLYEKTLTIKPELYLNHLALARAYQEVGEREKAIACFRQACALDPDNPEARWGLVLTELALVHDSMDVVGNYRDAFARGLDELDAWFDSTRVQGGFNAIGTQQPFYLAYHDENNRNLLARYGALCNRLAKHWQDEHRLLPRKRPRRPKVRVGLVSAHLYGHSVWHALLKGWCEQLDKQRFELHIFSPGAIRDTETDSARACATSFVGGGKSAYQWSQTIIEKELDILIFPEIGMDPMTAKLANLRLAPVQATTWGHPETSGLPTMDYYISGADFEPSDAAENYTEQLMLLPNLSCYYRALEIPNEQLALEGLGIDAKSPLFICPGTPFKYAPEHDSIYVAIAKRLGHCQFLFFKYPVGSLFRQLMNRLDGAFSSAGLNFSAYAVEIPWLSKPQFNSLLRQADVYLDTIGFSGFNTAMQAIECGLPVVSKDGRFLRGRLASGILKRLDMRETIVESDEEYVELVVRLAQDPGVRRALRERIARSRSVLFDDVAPIRALEEFLQAAIK